MTAEKLRGVPGGGVPPVPSLITLVNVLLRRRKLVFGLPLLAFAVGWGVTVLQPHEYEAKSRFLPEPKEITKLNQIAALVMLQFYASLPKSREITTKTAETVYTVVDPETGAKQSGTFAQLYGKQGKPAALLGHSLKLLDDRTDVTVDVRTGTVVLATRARRPELAVAINNRMLDLINAFNIERRQEQASAEHRFVEEQRQQAHQQLIEAESALQGFMERNRMWQTSPQLVFEHGRLDRRVMIQQQVYLTLSEFAHRARFEEVRNTPVLTIVERPESTVDPATGKSPLFIAVLCALAAAIIAIGVAFGAAYLDQQKAENRAEVDELLDLSRATVRDLSPIHWLPKLRREVPAGRGD
jgi:uncharacterized protein involved in exopolysaccharide biosynthesis